jgi:metal-responsive CopG/Arc/MetJ family transcriptional regulator
MPKAKIAVTLESTLLSQVDALVQEARFANRSQAIEAAVAEHLARFRRTRLAEACARLDPAEERTLAEEGMGADSAAWPEY